jgi:WD40 repeat protein
MSKVIIGIPVSWDSCTASAGDTAKVCHVVWSPCGQFVAAGFSGGIKILDSNTLERISALKTNSYVMGEPSFLDFSPDGNLLACIYWGDDMLVDFFVSVSVLTSAQA